MEERVNRHPRQEFGFILLEQLTCNGVGYLHHSFLDSLVWLSLREIPPDCHQQLLVVHMSNLVDSVHTTAAKSIGEDSKYFLFTMLMALGPQMCDEATKI